MAERWGINVYVVAIKDHYSPLECMSSFFSYNLYLRDKSRSFFAHRTIFCKKCWHKQFFLKTVELWDININVVWKTTIVSLSVCRAFFSYNLYLRDKSRSFFAQRTIFCKKCWHKQFFLKTVELWDININVVWKTTIVPLSVCRAFFSYNRVFAWQITFFFGSQDDILVKNTDISNFFSKRWNSGL